jgi:hypothetical protein
MQTRSSRIAALSMVFLAACGADCVTSDEILTASVPTTGVAGPTLGQPVARFDLKQHYVSHTPYSACAQGPLQDVGPVELSVTSTSAVPLTVFYSVQGLNPSGNPVWSYDDSVGVHLTPQQTVAKGQIVVTPQRLDTGTRVLLTRILVDQ